MSMPHTELDLRCDEQIVLSTIGHFGGPTVVGDEPSHTADS